MCLALLDFNAFLAQASRVFNFSLSLSLRTRGMSFFVKSSGFVTVPQENSMGLGHLCSSFHSKGES